MASNTDYHSLHDRRRCIRRGDLTLVVTVLCSGLVTTGAWSVHGFPVLVLPYLQHPNTTFSLTHHQASWFATVTMLMSVPGSVAGGVLCEWVGPRRLQLVLGPLLSLSYLALYLISWPSIQRIASPWVLLMTIRIVQGTLASLVNSSSMVLPCEVSDASRRGTLASLLEVWVTLGFLLCYVLSGHLYWHSAALLLPTLTLLPGFLGLLFVPESPPWLFRKKRAAEAIASLLMLRNSKEEVEKEIVELKMASQQNTEKMTLCQRLKLVNNKAYVIPMITSILVASLKELSGFSVVVLYIGQIFKMAGVTDDQYRNSVISGSVRLAFNFIASVLLYQAPRKFLLVAGGCIALVGTATLGTFFFLREQEIDLSNVSWVPLFAIIMVVAGISGGVLPASWLLATEVLPSRVRSFGTGLTVAIYSATSFLISKSYHDAKAVLGPHGIFWSYSFGCLIHIIFIIKFVPETRGLTLSDIDMLWKKSNRAATLNEMAECQL